MAPTTDEAKNNPPPGSAYLDEMLTYLPSIGVRQFDLPPDESKRYTLLTVQRTVKKYRTDDFPEVEFWNRILLGSPHTHICLLPSTESAREFHTRFYEDSVVLKVDLVKPLMSQVFRRLVLQDMRENKRYVRYAFDTTAPTRRRKQSLRLIESGSEVSNGNEKGQWLDVMADSFAMQREEDLKAQVKLVRDITYRLMKNDRHVCVMRAVLTDDLSADEAATQFQMTASNVRAINRKFTRLLLKTWNKLANSRD